MIRYYYSGTGVGGMCLFIPLRRSLNPQKLYNKSSIIKKKLFF